MRQHHYPIAQRHQRSEPGQRSVYTTILFLLAAGERSHWHRVDVVETWFHALGDPLELRILSDGRSETIVLGPDLRKADVPVNCWQSAVSTTQEKSWAVFRMPDRAVLKIVFCILRAIVSMRLEIIAIWTPSGAVFEDVLVICYS